MKSLLTLFLACFALSSFGQTFGQTAAFHGAAALQGTPIVGGGGGPYTGPTNAYGWWKMDGVVAANGSLYSNWVDSVSTHHFWVYSNYLAYCPIFTNNVQNTNSAIWYTNISNVIRALTNAFGSTLSQPFTIIAACRTIEKNGANPFLFDGIAATRIKIYRDSATPWGYGINAGTAAIGTGAIDDHWVVLTHCISNSAVSYIRTNGVNYMTVAAGGVGTAGWSGLTLGGVYSGTVASVMYGGIGEVIVYNALMATNDLQWVEKNLCYKWNIPWAGP